MFGPRITGTASDLVLDSSSRMEMFSVRNPAPGHFGPRFLVKRKSVTNMLTHIGNMNRTYLERSRIDRKRERKGIC